MATDNSFQDFEKELSRLVESFGNRLSELKKPSYVEAQLRDDFLNPFFRALGWDMENRAGLIQSKREVEIESRTQIQGRQKRADYLFRTDGRDRFVCEAKKPAEELSARYAFQAKRYAWNKDLPLAVLTDFEEMKIYIVGGKPHADEPQVGEWKTWHFRQYKPCLTGKNVGRYVTEFANLYCLFDRVAQQGGCWDEEIQFAKNKVIVRQIGVKPIAAFDSKGLCCLNTVFMIKATVEAIDERFLLGVLNSKAIGFYWQNKFSDFKETFPKIKGTYLQQLPIPVADKARHNKLVGLVDKLLGLMPKLRAATSESEKATLKNAVTATDQQIDQLVYELYGLTPEQIALVEGGQ